MAENYPQPANVPVSLTTSNQNLEKADDVKPVTAIGKFPNDKERIRIGEYDYYKKLFLGKHFEAFAVNIDNASYNRAYARLRHIVVNFAGLLSKIMADMLFSEPPTIKMGETGNQDWADAFWRENNMDVQCYESALGNSYNGDALFKLRVGKRTPGDEKLTVIVEDITPKIYFPKVNGFNVRAQPDEEVLAWTFKSGDKEYLRKEIHTIGKIENKVYEMNGENIMVEADLSVLGDDTIEKEVDTKIDESLLVHIPNWKTGDRRFGLSDYHDLDTLFYALNNRMSKIDNILDKHGDPILMVPPGVLDDNGHVNRQALGVLEVKEGENNKPEYIVWDASLESAFKETEKLVDFLYLTAEISPDLLGMGEGVSESGRALKFKLMRTLAKAARKRLYYDQGLKQVIYVAQKLAKAWGAEVGGIVFNGEPIRPEIDWKDGLPIDNHDQLADEVIAVDAGLTSKKDAIMRLYGIDEKAAEEMIKQVEEEQPKIELPMPGAAGGTTPFKKGATTPPAK